MGGISLSPRGTVCRRNRVSESYLWGWLVSGDQCSISRVWRFCFLWEYIEDILFLAADFQFFYFCHVKRICNVVANALAKNTKDLLGIRIWLEDLPKDISPLVLLDVHWFVFSLLILQACCLVSQKKTKK